MLACEIVCKRKGEEPAGGNGKVYIGIFSAFYDLPLPSMDDNLLFEIFFFSDLLGT